MVVRLKDVAQACGVTVATVSRALRGSHEIAATTRERIRAEALRLGYRPDPALRALSARRWPDGRERSRFTIGLVTDHPRSLPAWVQTRFRSARRRAAELGYACRMLRIRGDGGDLLPRCRDAGIPGVVVAPLADPGHVEAVDWRQLAVVSCGYGRDRLPALTVNVNNFSQIALACAGLRRHGHRRIGVVLHEAYPQVEQLQLGAALMDGAQDGSDAVAPLVLGRTDWAQALCDWLSVHRPGGLVVRREHLPHLRESGWRGPYALLDARTRSPQEAGVRTPHGLIGRLAVEQLDQRIVRDERGFPPFPQTLLVDPLWQDGPSCSILTPAASWRPGSARSGQTGSR